MSKVIIKIPAQKIALSENAIKALKLLKEYEDPYDLVCRAMKKSFGEGAIDELVTNQLATIELDQDYNATIYSYCLTPLGALAYKYCKD